MNRRKQKSDHDRTQGKQNHTILPKPEDSLEDANLPDVLRDDAVENVRYKLSKDSNHRLDKFLQNRIKGFSRHQIQRLISIGGVTVNQKQPKASTKLRRGDVVEVLIPPRPAVDLSPEPIPLEILHEEEGFVVVNKQAGLIVHPARSHLSGTLLNALAYHFQQAEGSGDPASLSRVGKEQARPGVIHRLDKNTTGVIIVAKRDEQHWKLAKQFEDRTNLKVYLAVVHGCPDPPGGVINEPIGKHPTIREAMAVRHDSTSRESVTLYRVRERYRGYSLVELELKTGRTHQIRVHMSYIGHPLVGDIVYGGEPVGLAELDNPPRPAAARPYLTFARTKEEGQQLEEEAASRNDMLMSTPALHAALLQMKHPDTRETMTFTAPVHGAMALLIRELRKRPDPGPVVTEGTYLDLDHMID
ncbi:MAG: RluA family pseudouridine synthase [Gammaproteobacteria bacterium]|nr:MAG: RluA family pseudouridine synthase [Gammaproteobacteria bacterium]